MCVYIYMMYRYMPLMYTYTSLVFIHSRLQKVGTWTQEDGGIEEIVTHRILIFRCSFRSPTQLREGLGPTRQPYEPLVLLSKFAA